MSAGLFPAQVRAAVPGNFNSVREFFLNPPVASADDMVQGSFSEEGVVRFLCDEREFSRARVSLSIGRLQSRRLDRRRLEDFTTGPETVK